MSTWELEVRERIRDTIHRYAWAGDAFRLDAMAGTFCEDGVLEIRGREPLLGRAAIIEFLGGGAGGTDDERRAARRDGGARRVVRHLVTNTNFVTIQPEVAHVESYFSVLTEVGLDHAGRYRDELVPVGDEWLFRRRRVTTDWSAPDSVMVRSDLAPPVGGGGGGHR